MNKYKELQPNINLIQSSKDFLKSNKLSEFSKLFQLLTLNFSSSFTLNFEL